MNYLFPEIGNILLIFAFVVCTCFLAYFLKYRKIITKTGTDRNHEDIYDLTSYALKEWVINEIIIKDVDDDVAQREKIFLFVNKKNIDMIDQLFKELWDNKNAVKEFVIDLKEILFMA